MPIPIAIRQIIGTILWDTKYPIPTNELPSEEDIGISIVIMMISTNSSHNDKKNSPIFLSICTDI
jgi:hypothetical protein